MKKVYSIFLGVLIFNIPLFAQNFQHVKKLTEPTQYNQHYFGSAVALDGQVGIVGAKWDKYDVNGQNYEANAPGSCYIIKKTNNGWIRVQKITSNDRGYGINSFGNTVNGGQVFGSTVSISGDFAAIGSPTDDFDANGTNEIINAGAVYIFKKDANGVWSQQQKLKAPDKAQTDQFGNSVSINGNYLIIGAFNEDHDELGASTLNNSGSAYIYEKDNNGTWNFVKKVVASDRRANDFFGYSVAITSSGYAIVGAYSNDYDVNNANYSDGAGSAYIFTRDGNGVWSQTQKIVSADREYSGRFGFSVDIDNDKCIVGADLETEGGQTYAGSAYIYERNNGTYAFTQKLTASDLAASDGFGKTVRVSGNNVIVTATGQSVSGFANAGSIYVVAKQQNNTWQEMQQITANDPNTFDLFGINSDIDGSTIISGVYFNDKDSNGVNSVTDAGAAYVFEEIIPCVQTDSSITVSSCESYTSPTGLTYTISGLYTDTLVNFNGCDSIVHIDLAILNSTQMDTTIEACGSVMINNVNYVNSGNYTQTLVNNVGCDSLINIHVTILSSTEHTITPASCDSYTSPNSNVWTVSGSYTDTLVNAVGCDSLLHINLTVWNSNQIDTTVNSCGAYTLNNITYNNSGNYTQTLTNQYGCDSIINLDLIVISVDTSVQINDNVLTAVSNNSNFQWYNCDDEMNVQGEVSQSFTAAETGNYALIISNNNCIDTSSCYEIILGSTDYLASNEFSISPNPFNDEFIIKNTLDNNYKIQITDLNGKLVFERISAETHENKINLNSVNTGIYLLSIRSNEKVFVYRIVKE